MAKNNIGSTQIHTSNGDNVGKNKYEFHNHTSHPSDLFSAIEEFQEIISQQKDAVEFIEILADYLKDSPGRNVVGLETKLKNANMEYLLDDALVLKERFAKVLFRGQLSHSSQQLYAHALALINTLFSHKIKPLIKQGHPIDIIETRLLDDVFMPVFQNTSKIDMAITIDHIRGMLYFLTGKCHTKWT